MPRKLDRETVVKIAYSGEPGSVLARRYGVSRQMVSLIKRGFCHVEVTYLTSVPDNLTAEQVLDARRRHRSGVRLSILQHAYGVSFKAVKNAALGHTWQHLNAIEPPVLAAVSRRIGLRTTRSMMKAV